MSLTAVDARCKVWGLVPAGGSGERFGGDTPKQLIDLAGRPLLSWTLERLLDAGLTGLTVALPEAWLAKASDIFEGHGKVRWVAGGDSRQRSVAACLAASPNDVGLVLVHDGARPAVAVSDVQATISAVGEAGGAILVRPVDDTLKRLEGTRVAGTVDRRTLFRAETPQVFRPEILARALEASVREGFEGTDEAALVERLDSVCINTAMAGKPNPKLTRPEDLAWLEVLLGKGDVA